MYVADHFQKVFIQNSYSNIIENIHKKGNNINRKMCVLV